MMLGVGPNKATSRLPAIHPVSQKLNNNYRLKAMKQPLHPLYLLILVLFAVVSCREGTPRPSGTQQKPNIIFILADDLGYGDIGVFYQNRRAEEGKPHHKTPNLDRMAEEGMRLNRHYVGAPVCAPSRASLLQGLHQGHSNVRNNQFDKALADNHTLASVLKEAGYATGLVGKYGLQGLDGDSPDTWQAYPTKRGFDHFFGYVRHRDGHNHYPAHQVRERPAVELYWGTEEISGQLKGAYTTDLFTAAAKKWIIEQEQDDSGRPFFLYLAYDTPHAGLEVASAPYPEGGGLNGGVQWIGEEGRFINTVSDTIDSYIHPDYAGQDWPEPQKRFASMVRRVDSGVGDILQLLKDLDMDKNTLVVFSSDNGPHHESYGYGPYDPTFFDSFGPLDGTKRDTWEGGIRVPAIVRWPGGISAGTASDQPNGFHDWLPTFAELAGVPAPANTDGVSLLPSFTGQGTQPASTVYVEYSQNGRTPEYSEFHSTHQGQRRGEMQVIYLDGYKGVRYNITSVDDNFRIYDTHKDSGETVDLGSSSPVFGALQQRMKDRALRVRRPDPTAPRPYDEVPVPALDVPQNLQSGLHYQVYEAATPWTPNVSTLKQSPAGSGSTDGFGLDVRTRDEHIVVAFNGLIEVPETGEYTFWLQADRGAVLRIHEATVIDADKGYEPESVVSSRIRLEAGFHPVQLVYARGEAGTPSLQLQWSGPGFDRQAIASENLRHQADTEPAR